MFNPADSAWRRTNDFKFTLAGEKLLEEVESVDRQLEKKNLIVKALDKRKIRVLPNGFAEKALKNNEELQTVLERPQTRYNTVSQQLHAKPRDVRKSRSNVGDEVAALRPAAEAGAVVFVRGSGTVLTGGKRTFGRLGDGGTSNRVQVVVSFADARPGTFWPSWKSSGMAIFGRRPRG
jgi:hypothetical protein